MTRQPLTVPGQEGINLSDVELNLIGAAGSVGGFKSVLGEEMELSDFSVGNALRILDFVSMNFSSVSKENIVYMC